MQSKWSIQILNNWIFVSTLKSAFSCTESCYAAPWWLTVLLCEVATKLFTGEVTQLDNTLLLVPKSCEIKSLMQIKHRSSILLCGLETHDFKAFSRTYNIFGPESSTDRASWICYLSSSSSFSCFSSSPSSSSFHFILLPLFINSSP